MRIKVERDHSFDADDTGGWMVVKYHRTGWSVVYRGDIAECQDYARDLADETELSDEIAACDGAYSRHEWRD